MKSLNETAESSLRRHAADALRRAHCVALESYPPDRIEMTFANWRGLC